MPTGTLLVQGTLDTGGLDVGVAVNGTVAAVQAGRFAVQVPVATDTHVLTATLTTATGATTSHSVVVSASASPSTAPTLRPLPAAGAAPLTVRFSLGGITPSSLTLDVDGDGRPDFTGTSLQERTFTYTQPGLYLPVATVQDAQGARFTVTAVVLIEPPTVVTARFQNLWNGFKAKLVAGDIPGALGHLSPAIRPQFSQVFPALGQNLPSVAASLEPLAVVENLDDLAKAVITRREGSTPFLYFIYFRRDSLGRWLIEEM